MRPLLPSLKKLVAVTTALAVITMPNAFAVTATYDLYLGSQYSVGSGLSLQDGNGYVDLSQSPDQVLDSSANFTATNNNTSWNAGLSALEVTTKSSNDEALPDSGSTSGFVSMSGNQALYHLNESSGSPQDSSGNANHLTTAGSPNYSHQGKIQTGIYLDSSDYLYDTVDGTAFTEMTVMYWVYAYGTSTNRTQFSWNTETENGDSTPFMFIRRGTSGGNMDAYVDGNYNLSASSVAPSRSGWHHVVVTLGTDKNWEMFVDGVSVDTYADTNTPGTVTYLDSAEEIYINQGFGNRDAAVYDEVAIFNRELSSSEIATVYNTQKENYQYGGSFLSSIFDAGSSSSWTTLSWIPDAPYGKPLPNSEAVETGYTNGNIDMTTNIGLYHFDGDDDDSSGNGNNGSCSTCPTYSTNEFITGSSALFDTDNDKVTVSGIDITPETHTNLSASVWIQPTQITGQDVIFSIDSGNYDRTLELNGGVVRVGDGNNYQSSSLSAPRGQWSHVVAVWTPTDTHVYVNNTKYSTGLTPSSDGSSTTLNIADHPGTSRDFEGFIDELAFFSDALTDAEVEDLYQRGAFRMRHQIRSCDDSACSGESFVGPSSSTTNYFDEINNAVSDSTPSASLSGIASDNQYFQVKTWLDSRSSTTSPELNSLTILPAHYPTDNPILSPDLLTSSKIDYRSLSSFSATVDSGTIKFQVTPDAGTTWYWWNGSAWATTATGFAESNTAADINTNIASFPAGGPLNWRAYFNSDGSTGGRLSGVTIEYDVKGIACADNSDTEAETITVTCSLTGNNSAGATTVNYATSDGTAEAGTDYTAASGTLTWAQDDATDKTFTIATTSDELNETNETITVTLSSASAGSEITDSTATITINDDDATTLSIADVSVAENVSGGNADFTVTLSKSSSQTITVDYATSDGTATSTGDYTNTSGDLTFDPGDTTKTISVPITNDGNVESSETFTVTLSNASGATLATATATGTITNDDEEIIETSVGTPSGTSAPSASQQTAIQRIIEAKEQAEQETTSQETEVADTATISSPETSDDSTEDQEDETETTSQAAEEAETESETTTISSPASGNASTPPPTTQEITEKQILLDKISPIVSTIVTSEDDNALVSTTEDSLQAPYYEDISLESLNEIYQGIENQESGGGPISGRSNRGPIPRPEIPEEEVEEPTILTLKEIVDGIYELEDYDNLTPERQAELKESVQNRLTHELEQAFELQENLVKIIVNTGNRQQTIRITDNQETLFAENSDDIERLEKENPNAIVITPYTVFDVGNNNKASGLYMLKQGLSPFDPDPCGDGITVDNKSFFNITCNKESPLSTEERLELFEGNPNIQLDNRFTYGNKFTIPLSGSGAIDLWAAKITGKEITDSILIGSSEVEGKDSIEANLEDGTYMLSLVSENQPPVLKIVTVNGAENPLPEPEIASGKMDPENTSLSFLSSKNNFASIFNIFDGKNKVTNLEEEEDIQVSGFIGKEFMPVKITYKSVVLSSVVLSDSNGYFEAQIPKDELRDLAALFEEDVEEGELHNIFVYSEDLNSGYISPYSQLQIRF